MTLQREAKTELISRVPLFASCSGAELARIASITLQIEIPKGEDLIREGDPGKDFFVLVEGTAEVRKGKRRVATLGAGDFVGEIALLTNAPRTATIRTTSPVSALRATRQGFAALLKTSPGIERKVRMALAERLAPTSL